jgi:hypothetical protein
VTPPSASRVRFALRPSWSNANRNGSPPRAAGAIRHVSGDRLRREVLLLLAEAPPVPAAAALSRLGLDRAIDPAFAPSATARRRLAQLGRSGLAPRGDASAWTALLLWLLDAVPEDRRRVADRLALTGFRREEWLRLPPTGAMAICGSALRASRGNGRGGIGHLFFPTRPEGLSMPAPGTGKRRRRT